MTRQTLSRERNRSVLALWRQQPACLKHPLPRRRRLVNCQFGGFPIITGTIPSTWGRLTNLVALCAIPPLPAGIPFIRHPPSLVLLLSALALPLTPPPRPAARSDLHNLQLTGTIPSTFGNMPNLRQLLLHGNAFTGTFPASIGASSTIIDTLTLYNNRFTGSLPSSICNSPLTKLLISNNLFTALPNAIGLLKPTLTVLDASDNLITSVPPSVSNLTNVVYISLSNNRISGE